jgi:SAM-dependent methyltransferase
MSDAQKDFDADQYKAVDKAEGYKTFFNISLLQFELIDKPSFKRLIGSNLQDKSVIDYGCGNGGSTKFLADLGPSKLVGVDLSETMIDMAIKDCKSDPNYSFVDFYVRDCSKPVDLGQFDIVFSRYFLHYGQTKEMLFGNNLQEIVIKGQNNFPNFVPLKR